jgi:hypothetical protein
MNFGYDPSDVLGNELGFVSDFQRRFGGFEEGVSQYNGVTLSPTNQFVYPAQEVNPFDDPAFDLFNDEDVVPRMVLQPIPAINTGGCPFGNAQVQLQRQEGDVPVYIVELNVQATQPIGFEDLATWSFNHSYSWLISRLYAEGRTQDVNDYAQMRLLRPDDGDISTYDVVSDMSPVYETLTSFLANYELMIQSRPYRERSTENVFKFQITFVLHTVGTENTSITSGNYAGIIRFGYQTAAAAQPPVRAAGDNRPVRTFTSSRNDFATLNRFVNRTVSNPMLEEVEEVEAVGVTGQKRKYKKRKARSQGDEVLGIELNSRTQEPLKGVRRVRRAWTQEERDRYNAKRRESHKNPVHGLTYDRIKSKLFHHSSIEEFYQFTKAVLLVPNTWSQGYCLAMAFLKSQCRTYSSNGESIVESKPFRDHSEEGNSYARIPILEPYSTLIDQDCDFIEGNEIVVFNPYKYISEDEDSEVKYCVTPSDELIQKWYAAAKNLHCVVEAELGMELDENSEATLQAYADVFDVHICLYNLEVMGKRTLVIKPRDSFVDVRRHTSFRVVSLLISDNHCSAITCLRTFLRNSVSANRSGIHNYCVFCEKVSTGNNETKAEAVKHFVTCSEKKQGRICCDSDKINRKKMVSDVHPLQYWFDTRKKSWTCKLCAQTIEGGVQAGQINHVCYMKKPDELKMGDPNEIYVYDFECAQIRHAGTATFVHHVNLVCIRRIYADEEGSFDDRHFETLEDFIAYVMSHSALKRTYLAHNGSKYDVQFIVKYLEKNRIAHHFVPSPGSMHAYLSVTIEFGAKARATFLDFRHFMPGSLKSIAASFSLDTQKGDFPHHFNNGNNEEYEGSLPILDHETDYWCIESKRTQEDVDEFKEWYVSQQEIYCTCDFICTCTKQKWRFKEELLKYCRIDVVVLAEACARYRNWTLSFAENVEGWNASPIDPFEYLTIPQVAMNVMLAGLPEEENITITPWKNRRDRVPLAIAWMERQQIQLGMVIHHVCNWNKEFMCPRTKRYLDGVTDDMHVFICLDCEFHGCPRCHHEEIQTGHDHPTRPGTFGTIAKDTEHFLTETMMEYGFAKTHIVWAHELEGFSEYEEELGRVIQDREMFKGGRTEVFSAFINADHYPNDEIKYHDVCSLYPYVCAFTELPIGNHEHYCGLAIDRDRLFDSVSDNRYVGYVRCRVKPNVRDRLGLLPFHDPDSGRLEFPLHEMTGTWGTEELRLAYENGYEIMEMYEVMHWPPAERSNTVMRGYVSFFLRMKQEAEGWKKLGASCDLPEYEEQLQLVEHLFQQNGGIARIRPELVRKDPVNRQLAKLYLNSLWGKFCQKPHTDHYTTIHGYSEFAAVWNDPNINRKKVSFRYISAGTWKVKYHTFGEFAKSNPRYNIYLSSKVTEAARCHLHRQMLRIGSSRILYCDTDSILFLWPKSGKNLRFLRLPFLILYYQELNWTVWD